MVRTLRGYFQRRRKWDIPPTIEEEPPASLWNEHPAEDGPGSPELMDTSFTFDPVEDNNTPANQAEDFGFYLPPLIEFDERQRVTHGQETRPIQEPDFDPLALPPYPTNRDERQRVIHGQETRPIQEPDFDPLALPPYPTNRDERQRVIHGQETRPIQEPDFDPLALPPYPTNRDERQRVIHGQETRPIQEPDFDPLALPPYPTNRDDEQASGAHSGPGTEEDSPVLDIPPCQGLIDTTKYFKALEDDPQRVIYGQETRPIQEADFDPFAPPPHQTNRDGRLKLYNGQETRPRQGPDFDPFVLPPYPSTRVDRQKLYNGQETRPIQEPDFAPLAHPFYPSTRVERQKLYNAQETRPRQEPDFDPFAFPLYPSTRVDRQKLFNGQETRPRQEPDFGPFAPPPHPTNRDKIQSVDNLQNTQPSLDLDTPPSSPISCDTDAKRDFVAEKSNFVSKYPEARVWDFGSDANTSFMQLSNSMNEMNAALLKWAEELEYTLTKNPSEYPVDSEVVSTDVAAENNPISDNAPPQAVVETTSAVRDDEQASGAHSGPGTEEDSPVLDIPPRQGLIDTTKYFKALEGIDVKMEVNERDADNGTERGRDNEDLAVQSTPGCSMTQGQVRHDLNNLKCDLTKVSEFSLINNILLHVPTFPEDFDFFSKKYNMYKQQNQIKMCPGQPLTDENIKRSNDHITFGMFSVYRDEIASCIQSLLEVMNAIDLVRAIGFDLNDPTFWPKVNVEKNVRKTIRTLISFIQDPYELNSLNAQVNKGNVFVESKKNYESICAAKVRGSKKIIPKLTDLSEVKGALPQEVKSSIQKFIMQRPKNMTGELLKNYDSSLLNEKLEMTMKYLPPEIFRNAKPSVVAPIAKKGQAGGQKISPFFSIREYDEKRCETNVESSYHRYEYIDDYPRLESISSEEKVDPKDKLVVDSASEENEEMVEINKFAEETRFQNGSLSTFTDRPQKTKEYVSVDLSCVYEEEQSKFLDTSKSPYKFPKCMTPMSDEKSHVSYAASYNSSNTYESIDELSSEAEQKCSELTTAQTEGTSNEKETQDNFIYGNKNTYDLDIPTNGKVMVHRDIIKQKFEKETRGNKRKTGGIKHLLNYLSCNLFYPFKDEPLISLEKTDTYEDLPLADKEILFYGFPKAEVRPQEKRQKRMRNNSTQVTQSEVWRDAQGDHFLLKEFRGQCCSQNIKKLKDTEKEIEYFF